MTATTAETVESQGSAEAQRPRRTHWVRELIETLLLTAIIFLGVRALVQSFRVEGHSMVPSLQPNELVLVNKALYWRIDDDRPWSFLARGPADGKGGHYLFRGPQRGEIVVFVAPRTLGPEQDYIKRVIGLPGEHLEIRDGDVYVNGARLDEPYLHGMSTEAMQFDVTSWDVPPGQYFVMGDNRGGSSDSRSWGYVPIDSVIGKAMFRYWPLSELGGIPHAYSPPAWIAGEVGQYASRWPAAAAAGG